MKEHELPELHPLIRKTRETEEKGVVIIENINKLPTPENESYVCSHMVIALSHRGSVKAKYDMRPVEFQPNEISVVYPHHTITPTETTDDYLCTLIVVSIPLFDELKCRSAYRNHLEYHRNPSFMLNEKQMETMTDVLKVLKAIVEMDCETRKDMLIDSLGIIFMMLDEYKRVNRACQEAEREVKPWSSGELLFTRFYDTIVKYHRKSHEVKFYANLQHLSSKYFSNVIKKVTGSGANEWISHYLVVQAKTMLDKRKDYTVQQIANILGFSDQATFSRHFKANTGISPTDYRHRIERNTKETGRKFMLTKPGKVD